MRKIVKFSESYIQQARELVLADYDEERAAVAALPAFDEIPDEAFEGFVENGLGVVMLDGDGKMLGFLCCDDPWGNAFGSAAMGTFVPAYGHGAVAENRGAIYKRLYQAAAKVWVGAGIAYHAVGLWAHDAQVTDAFFTYGFGLRCIDAVRPLVNFDHQTPESVTFGELAKGEESKVREMRRALSDHLGESPCFVGSPADFENWIVRAETRDSQLFVALQDAEPIAFIEVTEDGESFASGHDSMRNICGAFCMPEHRGKGVMQGLLNYVITQMRANGFDALGVDFESYNPESSGFWLKYFQAYGYTVFRRIDECAFG